MRKIDSSLVQDAEKYVTNLLGKSLSNEYLFHSRKHTMNVTQSSVMIGQYCGLTEDDLNLLQICALFHDTGYILTDKEHEIESSFIATEFLKANQVEEDLIEKVTLAIMATKVPQKPVDMISEILCDADLIHLTTEDYFEQMELLRLEWQVTGKSFFDEYQFHMNSIEFFNNHQYHSEYGKTVLEDKKLACLDKIKERVELLRKG